MNTEDVLGFAKKALPWIGAAATGNIPALVAMAAEVVSDKLGVKVPATPDAIAAAVSSATPEQLLALKAADHEFQLKMREWGYKETTELNAQSYADTANARARDVSLITVTGKTNMRASVMLATTMLALAAMVVVMLFKDIDANTAVGGVLLLLIGKFSNAWDTAFQFEFGTNRTNKAKDETIKTLSEK